MGLMYALNSRIAFQHQFVGDNDQTGVSAFLLLPLLWLMYYQGQVFAMSTRPQQKTEIQIDVETETYVQVRPFTLLAEYS